MQMYRWPGFATQLVGELQKQQNNSQFCDTLLQTEGISVPTHSCILTALSPYLSQRLASSPSPPAGQKVRLQLQDVKAQTLLKLVGLLYSGELEVNRGEEQNDVLALARRFGITGLSEGQRDVEILTNECQERRLESVRSCCHTEERRRTDERMKMMTDVQVDMTDRTDIDAPLEKRSCSSTGTQVVDRQSIDHDTQAMDSPPEPGALESPAMSQNRNITQDKQFSSVSCPEIHHVHSGATSIGNRTSGMPQNSALRSRDMLTLCLSLNDEPNYVRIQEGNAYQQMSELSDDTQSEQESQQRINRGDREQPRQPDRYVTPGEKRASTGRKQVRIGMKSLNKMKDMQETTETAQISVKVKLRRKTEEEVWEVVSMRGTDETVSDFTSLIQNDSNHRTSLNTDAENILPPPWMSQHSPVQDPDPCFSLTSLTNSPIMPPQTSSDSQAPSSGLEAPSLLHGTCSVEESDEQIEKLLEDIMMGLNILPNLERDSKMSHRIQPSRDGGMTIRQVADSRKDFGHHQMYSAVSAAGCGFYHNRGTTSRSSAVTGLPCDCPAQCPPSCSALSSVLPDAALIQQQECSTQCHTSAQSLWQSDGVRHQCSTLPKTGGYPHPEAPKTRPAAPTALFSTQQKMQTQERLPRVNNEIFRLTNGSAPLSCRALPLPCFDDMRLPPCLSPIEPHVSPAKYPLYPSNPTNFAHVFQLAPYLPASRQIPLSTITHRREESASLPQDSHLKQRLKRGRGHVDVNGGNGTGSCSVEKAASAERLKAPKRKLKPKMTDVLDGTAGKEVARRRKRIHRCPQEPVGSLYPHKDVKVSDATKSLLGLNICKVSLSSKNVLAKDRQLAANSCNIKVVRKPSQQAFGTESQRQKSRRLKDERAHIKTRGFVRNMENSLNETSLEKSLESVAETSADKQDVKKRKLGRPPKPRPPAADKKRSHDEGGHPPRDRASKDNLEKKDKTKEGFKKRRMNRGTAVEEVPVKKAHVGRKSKSDRDVKDRRKPEILKCFQKLFKSQHSKTRKSKINQESVKAADRKWEADHSSMNDSTRERAMDQEGAHPQDPSRSESQAVTVDINHNHIFNISQDQKKKSQQGETDSFQEPRLSWNISALDKEAITLKAVRRTTNEGTACGTGVLDVQPIVNDGKGSSPGHLPQKDKLLSRDNTSLHTPEETGPSPSSPRRIHKSPGCEEEEDEEEVDVQLLSPVKVHARESGLPHVEIIPDEEEEEESDIDVTGDEADLR